MRIEVVDRLGEHAAAWDALVDTMRLPTPFLRSWWLEHVAEGEPHFVLAFDGTTLRGGLALQRTVRAGVEWLQFCGSGALEPDHLDVVADPAADECVATAIGEWLGRSGSRVIDLIGLARGARLEGVVPGWGTKVQLEVAPYAKLPRHADDYLTTRPARMRNTLTRTSKRLAKAGVRFEAVDPADVDDALTALHRLHDGRWGEQSAFLDRWDVFSTAVRAGVDRGEARFHRLVAPTGEVVAIEVGFVVGDRMSFYQAGRLTDREWRGAGSVLRYDIIRSAIDEGLVEYDLLRGGENYKVEWANGQRPLDRVRNGVGPRGVALVAVARVNQALRTRQLALQSWIGGRRRGEPARAPAVDTEAPASLPEPCPKTVVFYTDAQQVGGAESVAKNLLRELDPGFAVTVVGTNAHVVDDIAAVRPGAPTVVLPHIADKSDVLAMRAHREEFAALRPDLFHFNLSEGSSCQYALLAALSIPRSKIVVTENSPMGVRTDLSRRIKHRSAKRFDAHIAVGQAAARMIEDDIGARRGSMMVIPNAVPVIEHQPPPRVDHSPTVGTVSRFDPVKGLDVLVAAMAHVDDARLIIVGDGEMRTELELQVLEAGLDGRVELAGWVAESRHLLPNFDVFVLPSRLEGMPMSLIEAMHAGVAVVATDVGSVREVITDGVSGLVVPPDDPEALAAAINRLLHNPAERAAMAAEGQRVALERFTSDVNVAAYERVYRGVLDGSISRRHRRGAASNATTATTTP